MSAEAGKDPNPTQRYLQAVDELFAKNGWTRSQLPTDQLAQEVSAAVNHAPLNKLLPRARQRWLRRSLPKSP